jgi:hypothetical protein
MTLSSALSLRSRRNFTLLLILVLILSALAAGQNVNPRVKQAVVDSQRVKLAGTVHPLARAQNIVGTADDAMPVKRMMLMLSRSPEQESALRQLLDQQQTPGSPNFHKWLTPAEFGAQFGPADSDIAAVTGWLASHGFEVEPVPAAKNIIEFSGNVGQVRAAFQMQLHSYSRKGGTFWANDVDPSIPTALAPVIRGFVSLNNYPRRHFSHARGAFVGAANAQGKPQVTGQDSNGNNFYGIGPADFAAIYNSAPLINGGNDGKGRTIGIVGRSEISLTDVANFRTLFGLPTATSNAGDTQIIVNGTDPGFVLPDDEVEAALDVQMANASAPGAHVRLVIASSTTLNDGTDLAAVYIVNNNLSDVMTVSYGLCESYLGSFNQFYYSLWEQAAAQGITVTVASGDNGSAGCDSNSSESVATAGLAVSGVASTPFNVAVGGTDFNDATSLPTYWNASNTSGTLQSAKGYIPEIPWNDSCASVNSPTSCSVANSSDPFGSLQLWGGSGGPSTCSNLNNPNSSTCVSGTPKPSWQVGFGDAVRDLPDVSLFAATGASGSNSFYVICDTKFEQYYGSSGTDCVTTANGTPFTGIGGTSAAAPSFAGVIALAGQKAGNKRLGNVNYLLYKIAQQGGASCQSAANPSSSCIFYDVQTGNNSMPCAIGSLNCTGTGNAGQLMASGAAAYTAGTGYDMATGLGSVNINNLVTAINTNVNNLTSTSTSLTLNGGTSAVTVQHGTAVNVSVAVNPSAASGAVSLIGSNGTGIDSHPLASGAVSWQSTLLPGGSYNVTAHYAGDATYGASDSPAVSVTVNPEASQVIPHLVTFDWNGNLLSFDANSVTYGSPYILRFDVMDSAGSLSATSISSKCLNATASCPTGTVTVNDNGSALDGGSFALSAEGSAEDVFINLTGGSHTIAATYSGDTSYSASSKSVVMSIAKAMTQVAVPTASTTTPSVNASVTLSAVVQTQSNGVPPSGTLVFKDNGTSIGGTAVGVGTPFGNTYAYTTYTQTYAFNNGGSHTITAVYNGDTNYQGSTSSGLAISVSAPFSLSLASTAVTLNGGGSSTNTLTLTPGNGFSGTVNLTCSSSSSSASCSMPASVTLNGSAQTVTVSYTVPALSGAAIPARHLNPWNTAGGILLGGVFVFAFPGIRRRGRFAIMLLLLAATAAIASCGGGGGSSNTKPPATPQTYTFTVTASATTNGATTTQNTTFTVTN